MSLVTELCDRIIGTTYESLGKKEVATACQLALDGIAVAVGGATTESSSVGILAAHLKTLESRPAATAIGLGFRLAPTPAALLNGASMHVLDFEPIWMPSTHMLSPMLPAILALAEDIGANGREIVTAFVKGIEIQGRLRQSSHYLEPKDFIFHQPGMVGPYGAMVAAAHLLKLNKEQLANAVGITASRCGGLIANSGTMTKMTHCGYAASLGLESALLAARGFTGNPDALEDKQGYYKAFFPAGNQSELLNFGTTFRITDPGCTIKAFPSKFQTHYSIVCGILAHPKIPDWKAIKAVRMLSPVFPAADRPNPKTGMEGKFSMQYTLAAALIDGHVGVSTFSEKSRARADIQELLSKVKMTMDPKLPSDHEHRLISIEVELNDGTVVREECQRPPGSWGAPPLAPGFFDSKIRDLLGTLLLPGDTQRVVELCSSLETLSAEQFRELMRLIGGFKH
jgi:aconitate decarboxylase